MAKSILEQEHNQNKWKKGRKKEKEVEEKWKMDTKKGICVSET